MTLIKTEQQLVALALNLAAHPGEVTNAAAALFRSLRKRNVTSEEFNNEQQPNGHNKFLVDKLETIIKRLELTVKSQTKQINNLQKELQTNTDYAVIKYLHKEMTKLETVVKHQYEQLQKSSVRVKELENFIEKSSKY